MLSDVAALFADARAALQTEYSMTSAKSVDVAHGRVETRQAFVISDPQAIAYLNEGKRWAALQSIALIEAERTLKNRDAARELQRKLKAIREGICPACGEAGCLSARATCTSCGTIFEAEEHEPPDLENIQVGEKPGIVSVTPRENRAKAGTATETATEALTPPQAAHAPDLENIQIGTVEVFFLQRIGSDPVLVRMNDATGKRRKYCLLYTSPSPRD